MANPLKKTMVYLGLADEELEFEEQQEQHQPRREAPTPAPSPVQAVPHPAPVAPAAGRAPVTPLRKSSTARNASVQEMNEILTVHPRQYRDAQAIAESFREGIPVIINLSQMSDSDARRLVDFASGLSMGLYGRIERVTSKVFLLSPENVAVSGDGAVAQADAEATPFSQP
jgi:cell division inhibitor SepF